LPGAGLDPPTSGVGHLAFGTVRESISIVLRHSVSQPSVTVAKYLSRLTCEEKMLTLHRIPAKTEKSPRPSPLHWRWGGVLSLSAPGASGCGCPSSLCPVPHGRPPCALCHITAPITESGSPLLFLFCVFKGCFSDKVSHLLPGPASVCEPPTYISQETGIIGVNHHAICWLRWGGSQ
jgi:hypothetical protein